jgi:hypothetical protein
MSNGPFMEVVATTGDAIAGPGEDLAVVDGEVQLRVRVECPNWLDVNRVHVPTAVSNPIFCDVDGEGFKPNGDMLGRPLPVEPGHRPTHGHDHPRPR